VLPQEFSLSFSTCSTSRKLSPLKTRRVVLLGVLAIGIVMVAPSSAFATCHAFTVEVSPASVREGGRVSVTVERDGGVGSSSVLVSSVDETAKAGSDYDRVNRRVEFTPTETQESVSVQTSDDNDKESSETFRLKLSEGRGCPINPAFSYGGDATITILDNDSAPAAIQSPKDSQPPASPASPTPAEAAAASPPAAQPGAPAEAAPASPSPAQALGGEDVEGGPSGWTIAMIIGLVMAGGSGAGLWFLRRLPA
jgi:hypothetical protein